MTQASRHHVLLVDDEPAVRESLALILESAGYDVSSAEDGFDGLLQLRRLAPDVIISDLNMPQMSGFEFLSVVRRRFPEIPVVAMSGAYDSGDRVPGGVSARNTRRTNASARRRPALTRPIHWQNGG